MLGEQALFRVLNESVPGDDGMRAPCERAHHSSLRVGLARCVLETVSAFASVRPWLSTLERMGDDVSNATAIAAVDDLEREVDSFGRVSRKFEELQSRFATNVLCDAATRSGGVGASEAQRAALEDLFCKLRSALGRALGGVERIVCFRLVRDGSEHPPLIECAHRLARQRLRLTGFAGGGMLSSELGGDPGSPEESGAMGESVDNSHNLLHAHGIAVHVAIAAARSRTAAADLCLRPTGEMAAMSADGPGSRSEGEAVHADGVLGPERPLENELIARVGSLGQYDVLPAVAACGASSRSVVRLGPGTSVAVALHSGVAPPVHLAAHLPVMERCRALGDYFERRFSEELGARLALDSSWLFRSLSLTLVVAPGQAKGAGTAEAEAEAKAVIAFAALGDHDRPSSGTGSHRRLWADRPASRAASSFAARVPTPVTLAPLEVRRCRCGHNVFHDDGEVVGRRRRWW